MTLDMGRDAAALGGPQEALVRPGPDGSRALARPALHDIIPTPPARQSRLLAYLPAIFSGDDFAARFLCIFEDILDSVEGLIKDQPYYFDPGTTPTALIDWMAEWVAWPVETGLNERQQRILLGQAVPIYSARGTAAALKQHLAALSAGADILVQENTNGFRLGGESALGYNTTLGTERPSTMTVTVVGADPTLTSADLLEQAAAVEKPLGTRATVRLVPR